MGYVNCDGCGKQFWQKPYKIARAEHHYCSFECRKKKVYKVCSICDQTFLSTTGGKGRDLRQFCSRRCANVYKNRQRMNKVIVACDYCGKEFAIWPERLRRKDKTHCCSKGCRDQLHSLKMRGDKNHRWVGGTDDYRGANWDTARRAALERDGYTCQICHITDAQSLEQYGVNLQVHHLQPYLDSHNNDLDNLQTLCVHCHGEIEAQFALARYRANLASAPPAPLLSA